MDEDFDYFLKTFGAAVQSQQQPQPSDIEKYQGKLPVRLLEYWKNYGWGGYKDGLFWIANPAEFEPIVEKWLAGSGVEDRDTYHVVARTAFGELFLWGEKSGQTGTIVTLDATLYSYPDDIRVLTRPDSAIASFFSDQDPEGLDLEDENEKPLFKKSLKKLGKLNADEMYGFEPALCIGGMPRLENLVKVKMLEHLLLLKQLAEIEIIPIDVSGQGS
jgi:hypothetical protein